MLTDWNQTIIAMVRKVRTGHPCVHNITNRVVASFTANGLQALGAVPMMAFSLEEVAHLINSAQALVLNMGTLNEMAVEAMLIAGKAANAKGIPIILDPVGVGATPYRKQAAKLLLSAINVDVIRGNAAEIANLIGERRVMKGVDAQPRRETDHLVSLAEEAARQLACVVVITSKEDVVTDGSRTFVIRNGHPLLTKVTGTGCLLTSVIGAFAAVDVQMLEAVVSALAFYGVTAEAAVKKAGSKRPGSFQVELLNQLSLIDEDEITALIRVEQWR
jgi:hydroxyethylthiazole kinase